MARGAFLLVVLCTWASALPAHAARVLLLGAPGLRPSLCAALRIQLVDVAEVTCVEGGADGALPSRIEQAAERAASVQAALAVLLERDPDPRLLRMYLVGARPDSALIAIERIEDRPEADVDRSLALKVRDALDAVTAVLDARAAERPLAAALAPPAVEAPSPRRRAPPTRSWRTLLEAGVALVAERRPRVGGIVSLGARLQRGPGYGELAAAARVLTARSVRRAAGAVELDAWGASLDLRLGRQRGRLALGGLLLLGVERVAARGVTRSGARGALALAALRLGVGLDLRLQLLPGAFLRFAPALELYPTAHRFTLDGQEVGALGRVRVDLPLSLVIAIPVGPGAGDA